MGNGWSWLYGPVLTQLDRIEGKVDRLMATVQDLQAQLDAILADVSALGTTVGQLATGIGTVATEVQDLIAKLGAAGVPDALLTEAQSIKSNLDAVAKQASDAAAALAAIPPEPA